MILNTAVICKRFFIVVFLGWLSLINYAHAWSGVGHRFIAGLAWNEMTPEAREMAFKLLTSGIDIPSTDICLEQFVVSQTTDKAAAFIRSVSWMDCSRNTEVINKSYPYGRLVHADRISLCPNYKGGTLYCPSGQCTSNALKQAIKDLKNPWAPLKTRRVAVKIILHFLTDLHQPLHAGNTGWGFRVQLPGNTTTHEIHEYWDSKVAELAKANKREVVNLIKTRSNEFKKGSVDDWVKGSTGYARQAYAELLGEQNMCIRKSNVNVLIPESYTKKSAEIGMLVMAQAAVRLADIFNSAAQELKPYQSFIDRSLAMSKIIGDGASAEDQAKEAQRILVTAGITPSLALPAEDFHDIKDDTVDTLHRNEGMYPGQYLLSDNGGYQLIMQPDGNLVLYKLLVSGKKALWASNTTHTRALEAILQPDGNFVLYNKSQPVWAAGTFSTIRKEGALIGVLQNDGNFVLYDKNHKPLWATNTWGK